MPSADYRSNGIAPVPAIGAGVFDTPNSCVKINTNWASVIIFALKHLATDSAWIGTEQEKEFCTQQAEELLTVIGALQDCECEQQTEKQTIERVVYSSDNCDECEECEEDCMGCCVTDIRLLDGKLQFLRCGEWVTAGAYAEAQGTNQADRLGDVNIPRNAGDYPDNLTTDNPAPVEDDFPARNQNSCEKATELAYMIETFIAANHASFEGGLDISWKARWAIDYPEQKDWFSSFAMAKWILGQFEYSLDLFKAVNADDMKTATTYYMANSEAIHNALICHYTAEFSSSATVTENDRQLLKVPLALNTDSQEFNDYLYDLPAMINVDTFVDRANERIALGLSDCSDCRNGTYDPVGAEPDGMVDFFDYAPSESSDDGRIASDWGEHTATFDYYNPDGNQHTVTRTVYLNNRRVSNASQLALFINVDGQVGGSSNEGHNVKLTLTYDCVSGGTSESYELTVWSNDLATGLHGIALGNRSQENCGESEYIYLYSIQFKWSAWMNSHVAGLTVNKWYLDLESNIP